MTKKYIFLAILCSLFFPELQLAYPATPKIERVKPLADDPLRTLPGVFFYENLEHIKDLNQSFQDVSSDEGRFLISTVDAFSGIRGIQQIYLPASQLTGDPGNSGWCARFFGDSPLHSSTIPQEQQKPYTTVVARWYHKFEEGFQAREGKYLPPKMARMRCMGYGDWNVVYAIFYWIGDLDGHISLERETFVPGAHREWPPNFSTNFKFMDQVNVGRWVHHEMRISLGDGPRSDRVQAWADGVLICDVSHDDLAAGFKTQTLNLMQWDCYWNGGSPVKQSRFYDDLMISTEPIGPVRTEFNPVIVKNAFSSPGQEARQGGWEAEVAQGSQKQPVVEQTVDGVVTKFKPQEFDYTLIWQGKVSGDTNMVTVDTLNGVFQGPCQGKDRLSPNTLHFVRVRQKDKDGNWSDWSVWHSGFATTWAEGTPAEAMTLPEGYLSQAEAAVLEPDSIAPSIKETFRMRNTPDTAGPYTITARVSDEHLMDVYLYYRQKGDSIYSRVSMEERGGGTFSGQIPGPNKDTTIEYYIRARDLQWNYTYDPQAYDTAPYSFKVDKKAITSDFNKDGQANIIDIISFLLARLASPDDPALDYNCDGKFDLADAWDMTLEIISKN